MTLSEWSTLNNIKSLPQLAKKLQVSDTTNPARLVQNWLTGRYKPSPINMQKILKATNGKVTPNDFYPQ